MSGFSKLRAWMIKLMKNGLFQKCETGFLFSRFWTVDGQHGSYDRAGHRMLPWRAYALLRSGQGVE
jgi:hypothetical protein